MKGQLSLILLTTGLSLLSIALSAQSSGECQSCKRQALLDEFTNPGNPDYEQKLKEWNACMDAELGPVSLSEDDPRYKAALARCASKYPDKKWYCYPSMVSTYLGELLTNRCFHMLSAQYYVPGMPRRPHYLFRGSYEGELEGGRIIEYAEDYKKPVVAKMSIRLYYNGDAPELVAEWSSENTINDPRALFNKLKMPKNIMPLLEDFEKQPVTCDVDLPDEEELCETGTGEIVLSGFKDKNGSAAKSFNRIVVSIYKGKILNGEESDLGPDYKVFPVGDGTVKVKYCPPEEKDDGYEWLRIYNSCDILPPSKHPYSQTLTDKLIIDTRFPVMCGFYSGEITITKSWDYTKPAGKATLRYTGTQTVHYNGRFKPLPETAGMEEQPIRMYGADVVNGSWSHNEKMYCEGDCSCSGLIYEETGSGQVSGDTKKGIIIITNVWPTDVKEVAAQMAQFGMVNWYDIAVPSENADTRSRTKNDTSDGGCQWSNSTSTTYITGAQARYKLKSLEMLKGNVSWSSSHETTDVSITDLTEAIYEQKPFDPEQDGSEYRYTVTWNLKAY